MSARVEVLPWERRPREGERAYAAFLAYRDLGPGRTLEATRTRLGKRPGYLKPIERWSALRQWRERSCAWDDHLQSERDKITREEVAKWERRRLEALEEGWQTCRSLRARLAQMLAMPLEMPVVAMPSPAGPTSEAVPVAVPVAPPEEARAKAVRGPSRWNEQTVERLSKLVVELEWGILAEALPRRESFDPLTATAEELKEYLIRYPRRGFPPPH